jgi:methylmalonyl-CoA/ethylmalonyl-CoA epimerase
MAAEALHHVGYVVPRIGPALNRWVDEGATVLVEPVDDPIQRVTVALLQVDAGVPVELVAPIDREDSPVTARLRRGGGLDHFCFTVPDVQAQMDDELERGALLVCAPVHAVAFSRTIGFVQRRSGLVVEFISRDEVQP